MTSAFSRWSLSRGKIFEVVEATATVTNRVRQPIPTPVAIIGLPGGLEPRHDQLNELVKKATIDAYEVRGREVVLYWRSFRASQTVSVPLSLVAAVPGHYTAPASRAYLYYTDEHKTWTPGLVATIDRRRLVSLRRSAEGGTSGGPAPHRRAPVAPGNGRGAGG
jgi:hypothetical protein